MPTGQTPEAQYERGTSLAYGEATAANDRDVPEFKPATPEEEFLFDPTDRPSEPLTAGAPFGLGPDVSKYALETDKQAADRVAEMVLAKGGSKQLVAWAKRRMAGE